MTPQTIENPTQVVEIYASTDSIRGISISSSVATSVIFDTKVGYRNIMIMNADPSATIWCAERATVTANASQNQVGWPLGPHGSGGDILSIAVVPGSDFFCINDSGIGPTRAIIFRGR